MITHMTPPIRPAKSSMGSQENEKSSSTGDAVREIESYCNHQRIIS